MGGAEDMTPEDALAALAWQLELGADEALEAAPVVRWRQAAPAAAPAPAAGAPEVAAPAAARPGAEAAELAGAATTLEELRAAIAGFEGCALKHGARNLVFADGVPGRA